MFGVKSTLTRCIHSNSCATGGSHNEILLSALSTAVPSAPQNLTATNVLANQFTLEWEPPFIPNGIIQFYLVLVQAAETLNQVPDSFFQVQQFVPLDSPLTIGAMPYTVYVVNVFAVTGAGLGDVSAISLITAEAREFVYM